ncbi:hypothetical protein [Paractinoplanes brasiliensis]|uniref:Uncharacterized protein n=1 Tax=Paractinoplanes brasiliensis TaxID=52695 RepID=A0A4R6JW47_9ACTN|nr:hypothetical protein [Actinoplanes brasiliensis]TDO41003.1 hypothetical protein C8E87_4729 [Actinoplanes brasiliensis]GID26072.1 hypothetical protein Abr02nite_10550 [Actinoplanes brasiliensis]
MQLHEFVDTVTADEPPLSRSADDIIRAGRRAQRRRRAGFASAGAAGLVAVVVAGSFALSSSSGSERKTPGTAAPAAPAKAATWTDAPPFSFTFQGFDAGKFHVQDPIVTSTAYQIASVYMDGAESNDKPSTDDGEEAKSREEMLQRKRNAKPSLYAYLTLYRPGAFDPSGIKDGKNTTVGGRQAVQATLPVGLEAGSPTDPANKLLAWEYTANAWATVTSISSRAESPSFADLNALVGGLKPSKPTPATLPFTVGYVPAGYQPVQTGTHALPGLNGIAMARGGDYGGATYAKPAPATTGLSAPFDEATEAGIKGSFSIFVTPSRNSNQKARAGQTACYDNGFCNVWSADGKTQVQVSNQDTGANLPESELKKIARSVKLATVTDQTTWHPAAEALKP